jgi:phosphohistidine phosphatase SixA
MANRLLYLARHGEAETAPAANPEDGDLTEIGRQQAKLLGKRLRGVPFAAIHHSPWTRAVQTHKSSPRTYPVSRYTHRTSSKNAFRRCPTGSG